MNPISKDAIFSAGNSCSEIHWVDHPELGAKAAMQVPLKVNGKNLLFQLDTGSDTTFLYDTSLIDGDHQVQYVDKFRYVESQVELANRDLGKQKFFLMEEMKTVKPGEVAGTIGSDLLQNRILLLNFSNSTFCIYENSEIPQTIRDASIEIDALLDRGKFILPISFANPKRDLSVFFDTGSSALAIFTDEDIYRNISTSESLGGKTIEASVWGKTVPFISSPPQSQPNLKGTPLPIDLVFYRKDKPHLFKSWKRKNIQGLIGNKPFLNRKWIYLVFDAKSPRFGISKANQ
jgi:hypothetical protein